MEEEILKNWKLENGLYTASLTPLDKNLNIDHKKLIDHCRYLLESGCSGVVLMGTTGEANSFSVEERNKALDAVITAGIPSQKLLVGTGCCALPDTIALSRHALSRAVGGVLLLPPFYYKNVSDDGLLYSFEQFITQLNDPGLEIYLYHFPKMSAVPFSHGLIERLLKYFPEHIAGIKDSGGEWDNIQAMADKFPRFKIYAGTERFLTAIKEINAAGCISASTNLSSTMASQLFREKESQYFESFQNKLNALRDIITGYPMVPALKTVMAKTTGESDWLNMRPPHVPLKKELVEKLFKELEAIHFPQEYC